MNEMQLYLDTPARAVGELVSAGLRELLRDSRQGPHLLLGTMWPEYWNRLTCHPGTGKEDAHPQARMLLADSDIPVPNSFFGESLDALRDAAESDPRLAESYRDGSSSRVRATQFLAGTPVQMARYRNAPDAARAVLDAAIDLRRFGQGPAIPSRLLAGAAAVAIGTDLLNGLDDDWFESALVYLLAPCRGVSGPLIRVRHFPGSPLPGQELFQVADYLEQVGRAARNSLFPSSAIVDVALREITDTEGLKAFGEFLAYSGRLFHAAQFHLRAVELGDCEAAGKLADLLEFAEDRSGAVEIARIRLLGGDPLGSEYLAWYLYANGQQDEAMRLCIEEFDLGNSRPLMKIREAYEFDDDAPGYRALEGRILSRRFPGLYDEVFCSKSRSIEEFSAELATRLGILVDEARVLVDEEVDLIASRLEQICEALRVNADEIKASTVRLKEWVESFKADWGVEVKSFRARIEACQEMGDYDMARRLIGEGMDRGIVGLEVLGSHLERYGGLDSSEPIERLGVDWSGNPNASWNLADVRRVNHEILEA
ncbi:hypothetical protein ABTX82_24890 [Streptomyces lavendulae]|uniref:hypothetical protein n=1 Tax=Streptomyces lavendulae TaxID=1914 RepID=UPI003318CCB3